LSRDDHHTPATSDVPQIPPSPDEFSRRDIEFHRRTAASYDEDVTREYAVYHAHALEPFLDRVAARHPGGRALDLGCGTGVVTLALARRGLEVVGVDHSAEMLAIAERKAEEAGFANRCTFETADVRALRFADDEFDCVTCQGLLHHLEQVDPCLRELARVLRPGGLFFISEPCGDETPIKRFLRLVWSALPLRRFAAPAQEVETVEKPVSASDLRRALDAAGLRYELEFLTHVPPLRRRLPDSIYLVATRALSLPWRRRKGDLVFVYGENGSS
jgi:ubiquinone/menaquinone biosynthesis C-methylase UbiE